MTKDTIQKAYQWSFRVVGDPKAKMVHRVCARHVQSAIDRHENYQDATAAIVELLREWQAKKSPSYAMPIKAMQRIIGDVMQPAEVEDRQATSVQS